MAISITSLLALISFLTPSQYVGAQYYYGGFPGLNGGMTPMSHLSLMNSFNAAQQGMGYPNHQMYPAFGVGNPYYTGSNSLGTAGGLPIGIGGTNPFTDFAGLGAPLGSPFNSGKAYFGRRRRRAHLEHIIRRRH